MNPWVRDSIALASQDGYLDKLHDVYSIADVEPRKIPPSLIEDIVKAHGKRDALSLVKVLLKLSKFPVDDIYVGFLRQDKGAIGVNPETVNRIAKRLLDMPVEDLIKLCKQPKVDNRRMGELFHKWFIGLGYSKLDEDSFRQSSYDTKLNGTKRHILTLDGTRKDFRDFANRELGCGLEKELDILVKVKGEYIIGEAKYFSGYGGHQDDQFNDAVDSFLLKSQGNSTRIAVLDGVVWLDKGEKMCRKVRKLESIAMSALLLPRFLEEIQATASWRTNG